MSIENPTPQPKRNMGIQEKQSSREKKKHKTADAEKKRKRDAEDGHRKKSKKHRSNQHQTSAEISIPSSSPFYLQTASLYLPLAPISQKFPLEGMCAEHLSPLLLRYYPPLDGVILSYSNVRLSETPYGAYDPENTLLHNIDEYAVSFSWVRADFLLFKPAPGVELEGYVNLQSQGHIGVVCWNLFNASIEAKRLPRGWKWVDVQLTEKADGNEGYAEDGVGSWVDENGAKVEGMIKFRVSDFDSSSDREKGFLTIEGTLLTLEEEAELVAKEGETTSADTQRPQGAKALGATDLSVPVERDLMAGDLGSKKHRRKY